MALYDGVRVEGKAHVRREGMPLSPRWSRTIRNHSPDGFNWGYSGSGPAQLALAILLEETTVEEAKAYYQHFKRTVIAAMKEDRWAMTSEGIQNWLQEARKVAASTPFHEVEVPDEPE